MLFSSPLIAVCPYSYSLEGLTGVQEELRGPIMQGPRILEPSIMPRQDSLDRGSLVSLTEEQEELVENSRMLDLVRSHTPTFTHTSTLTKHACQRGSPKVCSAKFTRGEKKGLLVHKQGLENSQGNFGTC